METNHVKITVTINDIQKYLLVSPDESLLDALRNASYFSVKRGCDDSTCGVCTVLLNGKPVHSHMIRSVWIIRCVMLATGWRLWQQKHLRSQKMLWI